MTKPARVDSLEVGIYMAWGNQGPLLPKRGHMMLNQKDKKPGMSRVRGGWYMQRFQSREHR